MNKMSKLELWYRGTKFYMWWAMGGDEKVKKVVGNISKYIILSAIGFLVLTLVVGGIQLWGIWKLLMGIGGVVAFVFLVYTALEWGWEI